MSPRLPALLALSALVFAVAPASAQKPRYTLTVTEHTNKTSPSTSTQTLRNKHTGKVIWIRHFDGGDIITWSKDSKAVAFEVGRTKEERPKHQYDIKLVVWKAGGSVQSFFPHPFIQEDYVEDMFWSPDKKHLLFRTGGSGAAQTNIGRLWCLNVRTHHVVSVNEGVRSIRWVGSHRVEYRRVFFAPSHDFDPDTHSVVHYELAPYESSKPRVWRLPKGF